MKCCYCILHLTWAVTSHFCTPGCSRVRQINCPQFSYKGAMTVCSSWQLWLSFLATDGPKIRRVALLFLHHQREENERETEERRGAFANIEISSSVLLLFLMCLIKCYTSSLQLKVNCYYSALLNGPVSAAYFNLSLCPPFPLILSSPSILIGIISHLLYVCQLSRLSWAEAPEGNTMKWC